MRKTVSQFLLFMIGSLLFSACSCDDKVKPNETGYPDEVAKIFEAKCVSCHNSTQRESRLDLSTWSAAFKGSANNSVLIPYSTEWSHLLWHINSFGQGGYATLPFMPLTPASLTSGNYVWDSTNRITQAEYNTIMNWVASGAPNKAGELPWAERRATSGGKLFALNSGSDVVAVVDLASNLTMHMVPVGQNPDKIESPHFLTISPDKQFFYVTLIEGAVVEKYRTDNYQLVGRASVGNSPAHVKISADGQWAIVSHWTEAVGDNARLTMLNTASMQVVDVINDNTNEVTKKPHGIVILPDFSACYITNNTGSSLTKVKMKAGSFDDDELPVFIPINPAIDPKAAVYLPYDLILTPDGKNLIVTCQGTATTNFDSSMVVRINIATNQVTGKLAFDAGNPDNTIGQNARLITTDDNRVYVACRMSTLSTSGAQKGSVCIIDPTTFSLVAHIGRVGQNPHGISVDPNTNRLYVTSENIGGTDPPHHFVPGMNGFPGNINIIDLNTMRVLINEENQIAVYPTGTAIIP